MAEKKVGKGEVEAAVETVAETKVDVKVTKAARVRAPRQKFVDLVNNVTIGETFVEVQMHPWLEAQIAAGHLEREST